MPPPPGSSSTYPSPPFQTSGGCAKLPSRGVMFMSQDRRLVWVALLTVAASSLFGGLYGDQVEATTQGHSENELREILNTFTKVYHAVEQNYSDPIDPDRTILHGAIPNMLRTLDPHSSFFDARTFAGLREEQQGKYQGLGMHIAPRNGRTIVLSPFPGSPASRAGLRPGDMIVKVDGKSTDGLTTTQVAERLRGPKGTSVLVTVTREGFPESLDFSITRAEISRKSVRLAYMIRPKVGFLKVRNFTETTAKDFRRALKNLNEDVLEGLILDLRDNAGGLLQQAVEVSDQFLRKNQLIVYHQGRNSREKRYFANKGNGGNEYPLIILVNCYTASAAEIVAGALQDHDRALILGESSFGKGLVQTVYPLSDDTGLALTTARYYTPSGRLIQRNYTGVSLYSYYFNCRDFVPPREQIRFTDGGRRVYGGGGINPDLKIIDPEPSRFRKRLSNNNVFLAFGERFLAEHKTVPRDFDVDETVVEEFRDYLNLEEISFTSLDWEENLDFIKTNIKQQLFTVIYGLDEGARISIENDTLILKALEMLPEAQRLRENPRQFTARRGDPS